MIEYGITTSEADWWIHVCPLDASLYRYPRAQMANIYQRFQRKEIKSAAGHVVPVIKNLRCNGGIITPIDLEYSWFNEYDWQGAKSDTEVGQYAEAIVKRAIDEGFFAVPLSVEFYTQTEDQFKGKDFMLSPTRDRYHVEVKADTVGGIWGSGNLFVQTHEYHHQHGQRNAHKAAL